ncbi:MFS transporter [Anoxybacter fermentans]|uniref:MFS transporter n=1 Tax=Anoxybacter fermentans TaxID=1323375 RepID=UPI001F15ECE7|nr:MFS transporter [Anoxybacter fermentans]
MKNRSNQQKKSDRSTSQGTSNIALMALSAVPLLMVLGNSMLIPEFPKIKSALDINQFQVGLLITLFSTAAGLSIPILGFLSDKYGRKIIIVPSVLVYGLGGIISGLGATLLDDSYLIILIGRVVQGIGAAGTAPIVMAMVGDLYKSNDRSEAMGVIEAANGIGKVISPVLGSAVALISWRALFFSYAILAIPISLGVFFLTQEPTHQGQKEKLSSYLKKILQIFREKGPSLLISLFAGMAVLFILFGVLSHVSDILEKEYNLKGLTKGLIIAIPILFMSSFSYLTGRYLKQKGKFFKIAIITGLTIVGSALFFLPFLKKPYIYVGILTIMGLGSGFVLTSVNTLVTSSTTSEQRAG